MLVKVGFWISPETTKYLGQCQWPAPTVNHMTIGNTGSNRPEARAKEELRPDPNEPCLTGIPEYYDVAQSGARQLHIASEGDRSRA